jgi:GntR family transcriptional repressor for pyruvate dehydrogenase complex
LVELRQLLEPGVCALAAGRATEAQIAEMRLAIGEAERGKDRAEEFIEADICFHRLIGDASQNPLVGALLDSIGDLLRTQRLRYFSVPGAPERAQEHHRKIVEMVSLRRPEDARQAMEAHLRQVINDVVQAQL